MPSPGLVSPAGAQGRRRQIPAAYKGAGSLSSMHRRTLTVFAGLGRSPRRPAFTFGLKKQ